MLKISILCTDPGHPVNPWLEQWVLGLNSGISAEIHRDVDELVDGDFLFLVSCNQIVRKSVRDRFRYTLVLHASDLPRGRGMSPHIWQILEGKKRIVLSILNAEDEVDSGHIWHQIDIHLDGTEICDEINAKLFIAELRLMDWALKHCDSTAPREQEGKPTHYRRRTPADSKIDPVRPLVEFFDLLRVADKVRYPAHFEYRGQKYAIYIEKIKS
jgi:methionyl-tRNA formyltransferase